MTSQGQLWTNELNKNRCTDCFYYIPKEIPFCEPDGLCERSPKILKKSGKKKRLEYPRISTLTECPERKMGEMLREKPPAYKPGPGRGIKGGDTVEPPFNPPTLTDLGLFKCEHQKGQT